MALQQMRTNQVLRQAQVLIEQGQRQQAAQILKPICKADPKNLAAWRLLAAAIDSEPLRSRVQAQVSALELALGDNLPDLPQPTRKPIALADLPGVKIEQRTSQPGRWWRLARRVLALGLLLLLAPVLCIITVFALFYSNREPSLQYDPAWSPDGTKIAYTAWSSQERLNIWLMNADGGGQARLFPADCCVARYQPDWSPDGTQITYLSDEGGATGVWVADVSAQTGALTGPPRVLWCCERNQDQTGLMGYPRWSPDGRSITFSRAAGVSRGGARLADIFRVRVANPDQVTNLTNTPNISETMADWSPDGARLIYHAYDLTQPASNVLPQVWSLELSSGAARPFVFNADSSGTPAWSPDGQWVAYQELIGGNYDLMIMDAGRTQRTNLSSYSPGAESLPAWSPDGRQIAFVSLYSGNADIWRINADGSDAVNLTLHRPDLPPEVSAWLVIFVALAILALLLLLWPAGWQPFKSKKRAKAAATA